MPIVLQEITIFIRAILDWVILLFVFTGFFLLFNVHAVTIFGHSTFLPMPSSVSFAANIFSMLVSDLAPQHVPIIVTSPMTGFIILVKLSFVLSLCFTFPVLLIRLIAYLMPALYRHEARMLYLLLIPLLILFMGGVVFAYMYIAPAMFDILYAMTGSIGVTPMLEVGEFIGIIMALLFTTGVAFTVPVFMVLLTFLGVVRSSFWVKNAKFAFIFLLVVSAIITPDGSGVSMLLLSFPVSFLYGAGAFTSYGIEKSKKKKVHQTSLISSS